MNAEIISIGTELLLGEIVDGNAAYLAGELAEFGISVYWISQVGDNAGRLEEALRRALDRSDLIITTGGLGPTDDDLTREAIAAVLGEIPAVDASLEKSLRARFRLMNRPMPEKNVKQAWLIPSAETLPNPSGTAPGWWVTTPAGANIASMPGVPSEMRQMWTDQIRPRLESMGGAGFASVTIKSFGLGESSVEERLGDLVKAANPSVATYAKRDGVHVRVAASGPDRDTARSSLQPVVDRVLQLLDEHAYGLNDESLASVVGALLKKRHATVATAESITGGLVASYLTDVPGSSEYVLGGIVAYARDLKEQLGVDPAMIDKFGLVSAETALALAGAARQKFGADYGIGTTGAAGPEGHGGKPAGTAFVAAASADHDVVTEVRRMGPRETVKHFVALSALDLLRRALEHKHSSDP
ncbi:MAG TPA: competence/damage-inducible protein A [Chloroflexota bacterium]|nr:competence/damage-inducible protein A [Chloroflexota bacterium]